MDDELLNRIIEVGTLLVRTSAEDLETVLDHVEEHGTGNKPAVEEMVRAVLQAAIDEK